MSDSRIIAFHKGTNKEKADPKFGLQVAKAISAYVDFGNGGYYAKRNAKIAHSRKIASGEQDMKKYLDLMNIDGEKAFSNIDMRPPIIAPKFLDITTQRFMERDEHAKVDAIDPVSIERRNYSKKEAEFRMENKDLIQGVQQEAGVPVEDPSAFVPEDRDELEFYFGYEYQLPEEIKFEKGIEFVLTDNDWDTVCKRKVLEEMIEAGFGATRVWVDENGKIRVRVCIPENMVYSWSEYNDLRDLTYCGEIYRMKATQYRALFAEDYRKLYGTQAEEKIYEDIKAAAVGCTGYQQSMMWNNEWTYSMYRPYDDWDVEVLDFEFKTVDNDIFVAKKNAYGNLIAVDKKNAPPQEVSENKEVTVKQVYNIYRGYYVRRLDKLFCWRLAENMIRPQSNLSDVYFSYNFYMPKNRKMLNITLPERMESSITQMTLMHLKIQVLIAKMRPPGIAVDINGLNDLDLGLGGTITPLELQKIYDQTGNIYYRSWKEDGETRTTIPINELPNSASVSQFQELISIYNFYLERLRSDIGTNEYTEGQSVNPKLGLGVLENQVSASNRANEFIYEGYLSLMQGVCRQISILLWDNIMFGGQAYRHLIGDLDLERTKFDVNVQMLPDEQQRSIMQQQIQAALAKGLITYQDAFKIGNIQNIKLQELYLATAEKKKRKQDSDQQLQMIQATSQQQQASAAATSQGKQQEIQLEMQGKMGINQMTSKAQSDLELQKFVQNALMVSFETGKPLPPQIQDIVDAYFEDKANQEEDQQEATDQIMQQQAAEQQQQVA